MAIQRFTNSARTVLTAAIGDNSFTDITLAVDSYDSFPAGVEYTVRVDNELMRVIAGSGTTSWTVQRGSELTPVTSHAAGAPVTLVLTAGVMNVLAVLTADQAANTVMAGPAAGAATVPGFRALATADLPNGGVTDAKLRTSTATSVIGRAGGLAGTPGDIVAGSDGDVLRRSSGVLGFGQIGASGIADNSVTDAKLRDGAATSVIGRAGATAGDPGDIVAGADGDVLRRSGGALGFGQVATAGIADNGVTYAKFQDVSATQRVLGRNSAGAGDTQEVTLSQLLDWVGSAAQGDLLYRGASGWARLGAGSSGQVLQTQGAGADPQWTTISGVATGTIIAYAGATAPAGYLLCDGSAVSRTTYAALHLAIGVTWGSGNGTTTFNVPDLRRRTLIGSGGTQISGPGTSLGNTGGAEQHTLSVAEMPAHSHPIMMDALQGANPNSVAAGQATGAPAYVAPFNPTTVGNGNAHNNMQPSAVVNYLIKT